MAIRGYQDLDVWKKAMDLAEAIGRLVKKLPQSEQFELSSQMRRAAVSIPSNIAEGNGRSSAKDYMNFLSIARGSNSELQTQLLLCVRFGYLSDEDIKSALAISYDVGRMLNALMEKLKNK